MEVHKNVDIPGPRHTGGKAKYPFAHMEPGDSCSIEDDDTFQRARRAASNYGKRHNRVYVSRAGVKVINNVAENGHAGGTIWRVE